MNITQFLLQTASYILAGSFIVLVVHFLFKPENEMTTKQNLHGTDTDNNNLLYLRLQAHERMIVYVDRINPANLLVRLFTQGIEVRAIQVLAINEIKLEFQHNISQQLYMDTATWNIINKLKDDSIAMINHAVEYLPKEASGIELSMLVLNRMSEMEENPYELTIKAIKQPIQKLF